MTFGTAPMSEILAVTMQSKRALAERHGYELIVGDGSSADRPVVWGKPLLLRRLIQSYDWLLFIDADAVVLDWSEDPIDSVPASAFQALVLEGNRNPNVGVWLLRASPETERFLDAMWSLTEFIDHPWREQAAAMKLLGYRTEKPWTSESETEWTAGTHWLSEEWNSVVIIRGFVPCRIRHYAGYPNGFRLRRLRLDKASIEARHKGNGRWLRMIEYLYRRAVEGSRAVLVGYPRHLPMHPVRRTLRRADDRIRRFLYPRFPWLGSVRRAIFRDR